ncbi:MAG: hypothetical protein Q4D05_08190 [Acinetobacter sp.]|nr:hypothetical protein [Acinetobacter sp.]
MHKLLHTATILSCSLLVTACGFHLKGVTSPEQQQVQGQNTLITLRLDIPKQHQALEEQLKIHLAGSGVQLNDGNAPTLKIVDYQFRRQQLNGKLTEILLNLNVSFYIQNAQGQPLTQVRTVRSYRNYQYDVETVNTENQQEDYLKRIMIDEIAQQISTQVFNKRLPNLPLSSEHATP